MEMLEDLDEQTTTTKSLKLMVEDTGTTDGATNDRTLSPLDSTLGGKSGTWEETRGHSLGVNGLDLMVHCEKEGGKLPGELDLTQTGTYK